MFGMGLFGMSDAEKMNFRYDNADESYHNIIDKLENYSSKYYKDNKEFGGLTSVYVDVYLRGNLKQAFLILPIDKKNKENFKKQTAEIAKIGEEFINYFDDLLAKNPSGLSNEIRADYKNKVSEKLNNFVQSVQPQKGGKRRSRKTRRRSTKKSVGGKRKSRKSRATKRSKRRKSRK
jgi:hypothetical protein